MDTISTAEFRRDAEKIIRKAQPGKRMFLTCRGQAVMRLEPIRDELSESDEHFRQAGYIPLLS